MPYLRTNSIDTFYEDIGEGDPIVVLHGAMADHQVWAEQLQPLTDEYRVITYDLRGHGRTGSAPDETFTVDQYVDDLSAVIQELELNQPIILGHSWGGMIGYMFAAEHPDQLSALVTVGSATPQVLSASEWCMRIGLPKVTIPILDNDRTLSALTRLQKLILGEDSAGDMDKLEKLRDSHNCEVGEEEVEPVERSNTMRAVLGYMKSEWNPERVDSPVLMLYGENEPMIEPHAEYLNSNLNEVDTVEIPNAGHNSQADNPEYVRQQIREFLNGLSCHQTVDQIN
jgi:3-oxoadipate enol-lactonase